VVAHQFAGPIVKLKNMALAVGAGDLHAKVDIQSHDEIGELAASFNNMVADLRHSTTSIDNLNREIKEREKAEKERIVLEQQLRQTQKLECIGTLAAGVAHEINTPIQFISTNTRFFCDTLDDVMDLLVQTLKVVEGYEKGEDVTEALREMRAKNEEIDIEFLTKEMPEAASQTVEGIDRVASIVKALKDFSYIGSGEKAHADINKAIENTAIITQNVWKKSAELKTDFDADLPLVRCSIGEIKQIILNLIINATHAITDALGADNEGRRQKGVISIATRKSGKYVVISVSDTGTGIPENIREKVFDPFFTTKGVGQGSGQGLSLAYSTIVEKHKGKIYFETEEKKGTTFFVELPIN
jgi:signal transduction histidine kinase